MNTKTKNEVVDTSSHEDSMTRIRIDTPDQRLPLGLSIEITGGRALGIKDANTELPFQHTEIFSTADSFQTAVEFNIMLGQRPLARDNQTLCRIRVRDIKWSSAGTPKVKVVFDMNKEGFLTIAVDNMDRDHNKAIVVAAVEHITQEDLDILAKNEADQHDQDEFYRHHIEAMLEGYRLLGKTADLYAYAKRKMSYGQKRHYKRLRKNLEKALDVMPPDATPSTSQILTQAMKDLEDEIPNLRLVKREVMKWYE